MDAHVWMGCECPGVSVSVSVSMEACVGIGSGMRWASEPASKLFRHRRQMAVYQYRSHLGLIMPANYSVRRVAKPNEQLHPKQRVVIKGVVYFVSSVTSARYVPQAKASGFEEVKVKGQWMPIGNYIVKSQGGIRTRSMKHKVVQRTRPRHVIKVPKKSQALSRRQLHGLSGRRTQALRGMEAVVVNLPRDGELRATTKHELGGLFSAVTVPRGIEGKALVSSSKRSSQHKHHTTVHLNAAGLASLGVRNVTVVSKSILHAPAVLGCSLSHHRVHSGILQRPRVLHTSDLVAVFEDDVYLPMPQPDVSKLLDKLIAVAADYDIIWLGHTSPETKPDSKSVVYCSHGGVDYTVCNTKACYGSFAYLVRRSAMATILQYWDVTSVVKTADGALRAALATLRGGHCVPPLVRHRAPAETGGSRIHGLER